MFGVKSESVLDRITKPRKAVGMAAEETEDAAHPEEALADAEAKVEAVEAEPPAKVVPAEPVSPAKEWAAALALTIVLLLIAVQFVSFLRSN